MMRFERCATDCLSLLSRPASSLSLPLSLTPTSHTLVSVAGTVKAWPKSYAAYPPPPAREGWTGGPASPRFAAPRRQATARGPPPGAQGASVWMVTWKSTLAVPPLRPLSRDFMSGMGAGRAREKKNKEKLSP